MLPGNLVSQNKPNDPSVYAPNLSRHFARTHTHESFWT